MRDNIIVGATLLIAIIWLIRRIARAFTTDDYCSSCCKGSECCRGDCARRAQESLPTQNCDAVDSSDVE